MTLIILMSIVLLTSLFLLISTLINKKKILMIISTVVLVISILFSILYFVVDKDIMENIYNFYLVFYALYYLVVFFTTIIKNKVDKDNLELVLEEVKNNGYDIYLVTDDNYRIKAISNSFKEQFGNNKVLNKKLYLMLTKYVHVRKINELEISNTNLKDYFMRYSEYELEPEKQEIMFLNNAGSNETINVTTKAIYKNQVFKGLVIFGYKKGIKALLNVSANLDEAIKELESIQHKFIASLEISEEAIFFNDLKNNVIWGNNNWKNNLHSRSNEMSIIDYKALIHQDDVPYYVEKLKKLTVENPTYEARYRVLVNNHYEFVYERGKRIFEDKNEDIILGYSKMVPANFFEYTGVKELDSVKHMFELETDVKQLINLKHGFQLVCIHLTNLPDINKKYGRDYGNIMLGEYVKQLDMNFKSQSSSIYRSTGLTFYLTLTDSRKMEMFKRSLLTNANALNLSLNMGSDTIKLEVSIGVSEFPGDGNTYQELLENNTKAINMALNPKYQSNYVYYKDIKNIGIG